MALKSIELSGFKSFARKERLNFTSPISAIVGPNGSGKSNAAEAFRFALGEQSIKSLRGKKSEDLIYNGTPKLNRASVKVIFDNTSKLFDIDFDEVIIERIVYRDGTNEYLLNGSRVRLKDITSFLSFANIGSTGHHIISQGESDKILIVSSRDRKLMLEDALGLKQYQYQKKESIKKLNKTEENIKEIEIIRRELAPQLKFLKRQVKRIEKGKELKESLKTLSQEYFAYEHLYLEEEKEKIRHIPKEKQLEQIDTKEMELKISQLREEYELIQREIGKIEGSMFSFETSIPVEEIKKLYEEIKKVVNDGEKVLKKFEDFLNDQTKKNNLMEELEKEKVKKIKKSEELENKIQDYEEKLKEIRENNRKMLELKTIQEKLKLKEEQYKDDKRVFNEDLKEVEALAGKSAIHFEPFLKEISSPRERAIQREKRRELEKMKIKLEEISISNSGELEKEYTEIKERDEFLMKEIEDLVKSKDSLMSLIERLDEKINERFTSGLKNINSKFSEFFSLMFGGGEAKLVLTKDKEEEGIDISVNLPQKKLKELNMLSGGERALTSTALLFAMSQINPPPFIILDETDAALDEANSRKYGDMIEELSKHSQLILITHNRETMSRAGLLYGITMNKDGISKLLSIVFDEAVSVVK